MPRYVTVTEAARVLSMSRRTIQRRINSGDLPTAIVAGRRMVDLSGAVEQDTEGESVTPSLSQVALPVAEPTAEPVETTHSDAVLAELRARVDAAERRAAELEAERARWEEQAEHWRNLSGDLQRNVSELTATLYRATEQKALPGATQSAPEQDTPSHPRWQFWRR